MSRALIRLIGKRGVSLVMSLVMLLTLIPLAGFTVFADNGFAGGDGTPTTPYLIGTAAQLALIKNDPAAYYQLINDITINNTAYGSGGLFEGGFDPIGTGITPFTGSFFGDGYTIGNLRVNLSGTLSSGSIYSGLFFGTVDGADISDTVFRGICEASGTFSSSNIYFGGVAAYAVNSQISDCVVEYSLTVNLTETGSETFSEIYAGGICGALTDSAITNCDVSFTYQSACVFSGTNNGYVGGLVGMASGCEILDCVTSGEVSAYEGAAAVSDYFWEPFGMFMGYTGGIAGKIEASESENNSVTNSYSDLSFVFSIPSSATVNDFALSSGGIVGMLETGTISQCEAGVTIDIDFTLNINDGVSSIYTGGIIANATTENEPDIVIVQFCTFKGSLTVDLLHPDYTGYLNVSVCNGGIVAAAMGMGTFAITDSAYYGNISITERLLNESDSPYAMVFSGGILGFAVFDVAGLLALPISRCLSNGSQELTDIGSATVGGVFGGTYGKQFVLDNCLFTGTINVSGDGTDHIAAGMVAVVMYLNEDVTAVISNSLSAGTISSYIGDQPAIQAAFAYTLNNTDVTNSFISNMALIGIILPSPNNGEIIYQNDLTVVTSAEAHTESCYSDLLATDGWAWSELYEMPVFELVPFCYNDEGLYDEPSVSDNPIMLNIPAYYSLNATQPLGVTTEKPVPYPLTWLFDGYLSSDETVIDIDENYTISALKTGHARITANYYLYDSTKNNVVLTSACGDPGYTSYYSDVYVLFRFTPISITGDYPVLTGFAQNMSLYAVMYQCLNAVGQTPQFYYDGVLVSPGTGYDDVAETGHTTVVFPAAAGLGANPIHIVIKGDCYGNGGVDVQDFNRAMAAAVGKYSFENSGSGTAQKAAGDVNGDGVIDALDAMCIELCSKGHQVLAD